MRRLSPPQEDLASYKALNGARVDDYLTSHPAIASSMNGHYANTLQIPEQPMPVDSRLSMSRNVSPIEQSNPWQHHHYISPSAAAAFANQQADRYICQTCNKAFSRPSSLRIHGHSHTGEKPFKCPHAGCGKAFSVRSNMKRHERGCHMGLDSA